jgi:hypothetical protein
MVLHCRPASASSGIPTVLTQYSYPTLFGAVDNNGNGLKVFTFLRLADAPFVHEHTFVASKPPHGQLPYVVDGETFGESEAILAYVTRNAA